MLPDGYHLQELRATDAAALAAAYRRNREHLAPYEPPRHASFFTARGQAESVAGQLQMVQRGQTVAWLVMSGDDIVGRINLNSIVGGAARSAGVGYWLDRDHLGRGVATGAVDEVAVLAAERDLHRLEAGTLLDNTASQRVLLRSGFVEYGLAPRYLFIAGAWQDHRLYQRILHDRPL